MVADPCLGHLHTEMPPARLWSSYLNKRCSVEHNQQESKSRKQFYVFSFFQLEFFHSALWLFSQLWWVSKPYPSPVLIVLPLDGDGTDLFFCVCQCPIWELSNSKQILLHILCIKSSETEQKVLLKCHMQLLYLVYLLNGLLTFKFI